jgi:ABC-type methionine transport system permease subunit
LLATVLRIFLSLFVAAVFSVELFLVLCLWSRHHHHHRFQVFAVQQVVLECVHCP